MDLRKILGENYEKLKTKDSRDNLSFQDVKKFWPLYQNALYDYFEKKLNPGKLYLFCESEDKRNARSVYMFLQLYSAGIKDAKDFKIKTKYYDFSKYLKSTEPDSFVDGFLKHRISDFSIIKTAKKYSILSLSEMVQDYKKHKDSYSIVIGHFCNLGREFIHINEIKKINQEVASIIESDLINEFNEKLIKGNYTYRAKISTGEIKKNLGIKYSKFPEGEDVLFCSFFKLGEDGDIDKLVTDHGLSNGTSHIEVDIPYVHNGKEYVEKKPTEGIIKVQLNENGLRTVFVYEYSYQYNALGKIRKKNST
jgi:hypothetical protein